MNALALAVNYCHTNSGLQGGIIEHVTLMFMQKIQCTVHCSAAE